ncbi:MAG: NAD(P)-binding protein [Gammaproteobacteria bacterium]|nr:NAD(P)-binding protein [Gammaproteobacteria bacterium]
MRRPGFTRRRFLLAAATTAATAAGMGFWPQTSARVPGSLLGPSAEWGHKLRDGFVLPEPSHTEHVDVAIIGGGISGLAAGYRLKTRTGLRVKLLELETETGGNARAGGKLSTAARACRIRPLAKRRVFSAHGRAEIRARRRWPQVVRDSVGAQFDGARVARS